jgi:FRG domain-containing protein
VSSEPGRDEHARNWLIESRFREMAFTSWEKVHEFLETLSERFVFRGHGEAGWNLETSLGRACDFKWTETLERLLQSEFRAAAHLYESTLPEPDDLFAWLALMQHHGVPTRLLDFTRSAYVAAYFGAVHVPCVATGFSIYAVDAILLQEITNEKLGRSVTLTERLPFGRSPQIRNLVANNQERFVIPVLPSRFNVRQTNQRGLFLCPGDIRVPFVDNLWSFGQLKGLELGYKIFLPHSCRSDCLRSLYSLNIHPVTLFPGLDGYSDSLRLRVKLSLQGFSKDEDFDAWQRSAASYGLL